MKYIIQDWACNTLQKNGRFNRANYDASDVGNPKAFKSFDDAWDWIYKNVKDEENFSDLEVIFIGDDDE